jgi:hypothetical protein
VLDFRLRRGKNMGDVVHGAGRHRSTAVVGGRPTSLPGALPVRRALCGKATTDAQLYAGASVAIASREKWRGRRALLASIIASIITFLFFLSCPAV